MANVPRNFPSVVNFWTRSLRNSAVYTSSFLLIAMPTQALNSPSPLPRLPHCSTNRGGGRGLSSPPALQTRDTRYTHPIPTPPRKCLRDSPWVRCCQLSTFNIAILDSITAVTRKLCHPRLDLGRW